MIGLETEKLYVTFLQNPPAEEKLEALNALSFEPEMYSVSGKEIFVYCFNGYGKTKLENSLFERKLKVISSTRNWRPAWSCCRWTSNLEAVRGCPERATMHAWWRRAVLLPDLS